MTQVDDILEELNLTMVTHHIEARAIIPDNDIEAALLKELSTEPTHVDDLGHKTGMSASDIAGTLTMMELKGMVKQTGGMNYVIAREL